jgi:superfamily II DNA helicase RecQ
MFDGCKSSYYRRRKKTGFAVIKEEQVECIREFVKGNDVFCILPTGYGKTACFACLPAVFDLIHGRNAERKSIVIVVSPHTALIKYQVRALAEKDISVGYLDAAAERSHQDDVSLGKFSLVFMSPEMIVGKWRRLFTSKVYQDSWSLMKHIL